MKSFTPVEDNPAVSSYRVFWAPSYPGKQDVPHPFSISLQFSSSHSAGKRARPPPDITARFLTERQATLWVQKPWHPQLDPGSLGSYFKSQSQCHGKFSSRCSERENAPLSLGSERGRGHGTPLKSSWSALEMTSSHWSPTDCKGIMLADTI